MKNPIAPSALSPPEAKLHISAALHARRGSLDNRRNISSMFSAHSEAPERTDMAFSMMREETRNVAHTKPLNTAALEGCMGSTAPLEIAPTRKNRI